MTTLMITTVIIITKIKKEQITVKQSQTKTLHWHIKQSDWWTSTADVDVNVTVMTHNINTENKVDLVVDQPRSV